MGFHEPEIFAAGSRRVFTLLVGRSRGRCFTRFVSVDLGWQIILANAAIRPVRAQLED